MFEKLKEWFKGNTKTVVFAGLTLASFLGLAMSPDAADMYAGLLEQAAEALKDFHAAKPE